MEVGRAEAVGLDTAEAAERGRRRREEHQRVDCMMSHPLVAFEPAVDLMHRVEKKKSGIGEVREADDDGDEERVEGAHILRTDAAP